ncbi:uncharacterized protein IWZ02DRAFT_437201 [Phyllosticta citriasiana]|uniref:uncharacterized protein n=1 Tax=Phyllosticta citriasiana TaxID=595635 RepID=UPI0030FDA186
MKLIHLAPMSLKAHSGPTAVLIHNLARSEKEYTISSSQDAFWLGTRKMFPDGTWRCTYFHNRPEDDREEGRYRDPPRVFPSMPAVCKQIQEDFLQRIHARLTFVIRIFDHQNAHFLGIPSPIPYIDFIKIKHLILHLWVEPAQDFLFGASHENAFIREPYSLKYNATGSPQEATLHLSESSQSPTPYFDVQKYGCTNDHALSQLLQAQTENVLPTRHFSKFGRALHKLLAAMGESNELVIEPESEAEFSEEEIHRATQCVEWAKQEYTGRGDSVLPDRSDFPVGYEEDALARYSRFCVGVNEHIEGDFSCGCPKGDIERGQW